MKIHNFIKLLSLSLWLIPLTLFNKLLMIPFFEDKRTFIALDSEYLIKIIDYTKFDIYLMSLPTLVFIIAMFVFINKACATYKIDNSRINTIALKTHSYLLFLFSTLLILYFCGYFRIISPYFYGY